MTLTSPTSGIESRVTGTFSPALALSCGASPPHASPENTGLRESAATIDDTPAPHLAPIRLVPVNVAVSWADMVPELERVRAKGARWPLAWVKDRLDTSNAAAFRLVRGAEHVAYLIVERIESFDVFLQAWIFTAPIGALTMDDRDEVIDLIDELARRVGAFRWRAEGRDGWDRIMKGRVSRSHTVFERDIA